MPMLIKLDLLLSRTTISFRGPTCILFMFSFMIDSLPRDSNKYSRYLWSTDTGVRSSQTVFSPLLLSITSLQNSLMVFLVFL